MNILNLTEHELLHYQGLYNMDPIVQQLCKIQFEELYKLREQIEELTDQVEGLESDLEQAVEDRYELERENRVLREKIKVWATLEE